MSNLMKLIGTVLALGGIVLGVLTFVKPGVMDVYGIKLDTAAILFVGGVLALGLGAIVDALRPENLLPTVSTEAVKTIAEIQNARSAVSEPVSEVASNVTNFGRKATEADIATSAAVAAVVAKTVKPDPVAETISALEQAKADVLKSMGGMESLSAPPPEPAHLTSSPMNEKLEVASPAHTEVEVEDGDLYVLDEKVIRGRPARILSDDTVEAETDEGWMRFENLEHLNEYLDSVEEQSA